MTAAAAMTSVGFDPDGVDLGQLIVWLSVELEEPPARLPARRAFAPAPSWAPISELAPAPVARVQQLPLGLAPIKRRVYELAVQGFTAFEISARLRRPVSTVRGDAEDLRKAGVNIAIPRSPTKRRTFNPQDVLSCPRLADSEIRVLKTIAVDPSLSNAAAASELGMTPSALAAAVSRACRRWRAHISGKPAEKRGSGEHPLVRQIRRARARGEYCRCGLTAPCWDHSLALRARVPAGARTARHAQMARPATAGPCPKLADLRRKPR